MSDFCRRSGRGVKEGEKEGKRERGSKLDHLYCMEQMETPGLDTAPGQNSWLDNYSDMRTASREMYCKRNPRIDWSLTF